MKPFAELGRNEIDDLRQTRGSISVLVPESIAKVRDALAVSLHPADAPDYAEVPPSPVILETSEAVRVFASPGDDLESRWIRAIVFIYRHGGRVLYREAGNGMIEARIDFKEPAAEKGKS